MTLVLVLNRYRYHYCHMNKPKSNVFILIVEWGFLCDCRPRFRSGLPTVRPARWSNVWRPIGECCTHLGHRPKGLFSAKLARNSAQKPDNTNTSLKSTKNASYLTYDVTVRSAHLIQVSVFLLSQLGPVDASVVCPSDTRTSWLLPAGCY